MDNTKIIKCSGKCVSNFQDTTYGKGLRVGNLTQKGTKDKAIYRCTVCKSMN